MTDQELDVIATEQAAVAADDCARIRLERPPCSGERKECPTCGNIGRLCDCSSDRACYKNSVWFNPVLRQWECAECWLK